MRHAGFDTDPDVLDAHAATLAGLAARLAGAANAARPLGVLAYGLLCQGFAALVMESAARADRAVGNLAGAGANLSAGMRRTADAYRRVEDGVAATLRGTR